MSRKAPKHIASSASERAKLAATTLAPVAEKVKPLAKTTGTVARRGLRKTRAWAAPQVERAGQVLQDDVAPKVSAMLSSAAERLDPAEPRRKSWRKPVAVALTVAASVTAALARNRTKAGNETTAEAEQEPAQAVSAPGGQAS